MAGERRDPSSPPAGGMYYHYHARNAPYNHAYRSGRVHRMEEQWNSASSVLREGVGGRSILPNPSSSHRDFRRQRSSFEASEEVGGGWMRRGVVVSEEPRGGGLIDRSSRPPRNHPALHHQWAIDYHTSSSDGWLGMSGSTEPGGSSSHDHQPMNQLDWSRAQDPLMTTPSIPPFQSNEKPFEAKDRTTTAHWQKAEYPELAPSVLTRADLTVWQREPSSSSAFVGSETGEYSESTPAELRAVQWPRGGGSLSAFTSSEHTEGGSASASETGEHLESTRKTYADEDPFFLPAEEAFGRLSKPGRASLDMAMAGHRSKKCSLGGRYEIGSSSDPVASASSSSSPSFPSEFSSDRWRSKRAAKGKALDGSEASRGGVGGRSVVASTSVGCLAGWNPKEKARERRRNLPKPEAEFPPRQADNTNNRFGMMRRHCVTELDSITPPPPPPPSVVVDGLHIASTSTSGQGSIPRRGRRVGGPRLSGNASSFSSRAMFGKRLSHRSAGFGMYQLPRDSSSSPRPNVDSHHPSSSSTPPLEDGIFPLPPNFSAPPPPTRPPPLPNPVPLSFLGPSDIPTTHMQTSGPRSIYRQSGHHSSQMTGFAAFSEGHYSREQSPPSDALLFRPPHGIEFQPVRNNWFHSVVEELSQILSSWGHGDRDEDFSYEHIFWEDGTFTLDRTGILDQHRDMRLDVDNMSYEELLALEEKIGNVSTGLDEKKIGACLQRRKYVALEVGNDYPTPDEVEVKCSICQDEFEESAEIGVLECRHSFHIPCIQQWLLHKNQCPVCKASAL